MSYMVCLFLRLFFIAISVLTIADNFNVEELNLPNTKELVDELDKSDNEPIDDSSTLDNGLNSVPYDGKENTLIIPRKRIREPILEVNSYSELLYVIEKYRCVAVLYEDGSPVIFIFESLLHKILRIRLANEEAIQINLILIFREV